MARIFAYVRITWNESNGQDFCLCTYHMEVKVMGRISYDNDPLSLTLILYLWHDLLSLTVILYLWQWSFIFDNDYFIFDNDPLSLTVILYLWQWSFVSDSNPLSRTVILYLWKWSFVSVPKNKFDWHHSSCWLMFL